MGRFWLLGIVAILIVAGTGAFLVFRPDVEVENENVDTAGNGVNVPPSSTSTSENSPPATSTSTKPVSPPIGSTPPPSATPPPATIPPSTPPPPPPATVVKSFTITGSNFKFSPSSITVNKGDTVRVTFVNDVGTHDIRFEDFSAATQILNGGEQETIQFVANTAGSFEYYCSVGSHRQMGMKGTLIVK